jgi:hypothetical protein
MKRETRTGTGARLLLVGALTALSLSAAAFRGSLPDTAPTTTRSEAAIHADALFWKVFNGGEYDNIPIALNALTAAYLADPNDPVTAGHIGGGLHLWRLTEQLRLDQIPATITDHAVVGRKYLQESVRLQPDARYLGQLAGVLMTEGRIHDDQSLVREGYFTLLRSIRAFPEFNLFAGGYLTSRLPSQSELFKQGLEWMWQNINVCIGDEIDRANPDTSPYLHLATAVGSKRVCWFGGAIAPHNYEGFFLQMGDMLVKSGDWRTGQKIYANARLAPGYGSWKFGPVLEDRIAEAQANVALFNAPPDAFNRPIKPIMSESAYACMACHQN